MLLVAVLQPGNRGLAMWRSKMEPESPLCCLAPEAGLESVVLSSLSFRVWDIVTAKKGQGGLGDFIVPKS